MFSLIFRRHIGFPACCISVRYWSVPVPAFIPLYRCWKVSGIGIFLPRYQTNGMSDSDGLAFNKIGSKILLAEGREWQAGRSEELRDGWFELRMATGRCKDLRDCCWYSLALRDSWLRAENGLRLVERSLDMAFIRAENGFLHVESSYIFLLSTS